MLSRKISSVGKECVACGYCVRVCPKEAIRIMWGISARVDQEKCAKVCPAAVIDIVERRTSR